MIPEPPTQPLLQGRCLVDIGVGEGRGSSLDFAVKTDMARDR